jgi:predicted MPP superfamily phosphohydrolase
VVLAEYISKLSEKIEITLHEVKINNLNARLDGLIIAQISDLHINKWNIDLIEHTIEVLNRLKPDIVTMTGDAICNGKIFLPCLTTLFKEIDSKYGKFTCIGNHDHSDGDNSAAIQDTYKKADFQVLMNSSTGVNIKGEIIYIAGADDIELGRQSIIDTVKNIQAGAKSIILTHNPLNFDQFAEFNPDLVLAGHTHGGQIFTAISKFLCKHFYKIDYISGFYKKRNSLLYVNRGIGTALLAPLIFNRKLTINTPRIYSRPEISLFKLISDKNDKTEDIEKS